jgi:hypothetical protein
VLSGVYITLRKFNYVTEPEPIKVDGIKIGDQRVEIHVAGVPVGVRYLQ